MLREVLVAPAAAAFLEVGTLVAVMLAAFGLLQWRSRGALTRWLQRRRRLGPVAGALLGAAPGCGGAIVVMPLYLRGTVSFGTVVATLTATMGDSSFVLFAAEPGTAALLHVGLLAVGLVSGAIVDACGLDPRRGGTHAVPAVAVPVRRSTVGAQAAPIGLTGRPSARRLPPTLVAFWGLLLGGAVVGTLTVLPVLPDHAFDLGPLPTREVLGVLGAVGCLAVVVLRRVRGLRGACPAPERVSDVLVDAARETALVTSWVVVAFVGYEVVVAATGLDVGRLPLLGVAGVLVGAGLGLVPGCGPQLVLTGLYAQGVLPLPVLVANALSQDGDALLPLLAADRRAAVQATALSTVPGLVAGGTLLALGW